MINNTDQENIILNASISKFNNIFPTYISEKNPKFLEIDDKYIGGLIVYNYSNKFSNKLIYIDKIWRIIGGTSTPITAQFIYKIFKTIRKLNGGAISITQDVSDMLSLENR